MNEVPITIEDMVAQLGGSPNVNTDPAPTTQEPTAGEPLPQPTEPVPNEPAPQAQVDPNANPEPTPTPAPTEPQPQPAQPLPNKANEAFAMMRQDNKRLQDTLKIAAELLGVQDNTDVAKAIESINQKKVEKQAQEQSVPVELLQRLNTQEQQLAQFFALQRQTAVQQDFGTLRTKYNLDDTAVNDFINLLVQNDLNPLEKEVNITKEYVWLNHEKMIQDAVAKAVAAEQQRAALAAKGSNPGNTQSGAGQLGDPQKVNSVRDLNIWMQTQMAQNT